MKLLFFCNAKWPEIAENLYWEQIPSDRADLVRIRVFNEKLDALMKELTLDNVLGGVKAYTYVIEWQKRGLPHAYILLILDKDSKIRTSSLPEDVDKIVFAEIPNMSTEPRLFSVIKSCMIQLKTFGFFHKNSIYV